jgi:hypothetical protein
VGDAHAERHAKKRADIALRAQYGQQSATGATHGAADPEQVNVPASSEEGIRDGHNRRITRNPGGCPPSVRDMDSARPHVTAQPVDPARYSGFWPLISGIYSYNSGRFYPCRIQLSLGSALVAAPESETTGGWCWQSHQVPPGQSS